MYFKYQISPYAELNAALMYALYTLVLTDVKFK